MGSRKEKMIKALRITINALKNDTVHYNWGVQSSCNCGVVAQAITGLNSDELQDVFNKQISMRLKETKQHKKEKLNPTWKNGIKYLCPITGLSNIEIIDKLESNGLRKEDITHLEFMSNEAILERSSIKTYEMVTKSKAHVVGTTEVTRLVPHSNLIKRLLGYKESETYTKDIIEYRDEVSKVGDKDYYTRKENLIKYLQGWLSILNEGSQKKSIQAYDKTELEAEILVAVSEENYEGAALLRDRLNEMI